MKKVPKLTTMSGRSNAKRSVGNTNAVLSIFLQGSERW